MNYYFGFLLLALTWAVPAYGQESEGITEVPYEPVNPRYEQEADADSRFLQHAHIVNQAMVRIGELAKSRADDQSVEAFGEKLVFEHKYLDKRVEKLAKQQDVDLELTDESKELTQVEANMEAVNKRISQAQDKNFRQVFVNQVVQAHKISLDQARQFEKELTEAKVKEYARFFIDAEEEHLQKASMMNRVAE